jgi:hypothetical protein
MNKVIKFLIEYRNGEFKSVKKHKQKNGGNTYHDIEKMNKDSNYEYVNNWLQEKYHTEGMGVKAIISNYNLPIGYSVLRKLMFEKLEMETRIGTSDWIRNFRKEKVIKEHQDKTGWFDSNVIRKNKKKGLQGYYFNKSMNKFVWIRSSYEYIFAKWLDSNNSEWDVEYKSYRLNDNTLYKPDFFIFENSKVIKIVEIKGYWDNNTYKFHLLDNSINIEMMLIDSSKISDYSNETLAETTKKWKSLREINKMKMKNENK